MDGPGIVAQAARTGTSVRADDVRDDPRYVPLIQEVPIRSELAVPIQSADEVLGVVNLESTRPARYGALDQAGLAHVCRHLGTALANLRHRVRERETLLGTITALSSLVEQKDDYTEGHCQRIAQMAVAVGIRMGLSPERLDHLTYAGMLHDIGKIAVPDAVLGRRGRLTDEERHLVEQHPRLGAQVLERIQMLEPVARIVEQHHERHDGEGYPDGRKGEEICLEARILAVVDAFDAMTSTRPYRLARRSAACNPGRGPSSTPKWSTSSLGTSLPGLGSLATLQLEEATRSWGTGGAVRGGEPGDDGPHLAYSRSSQEALPPGTKTRERPNSEGSA